MFDEELRTNLFGFCTQAYVVFFLGIFVPYWLIPRQQIRNALLLIASFSFYAVWDPRLACLIGCSTFLDYWLARGIDAHSSSRIRKILLTTSIVGNLSVLCYFKYANFFLASLQSLLHGIGADTSVPVLSVILPIGISFYTFESINYAVDVYVRRIPAERNVVNFMLFITFFPHLIAGPIVRGRDFLPQTHQLKHWSWARMNLGVQFFLMGMFKKLVIANRMACFVDPIFHDPAAYSSRHVWMAVFAYALQIYGDFSGYTDMAIGSAHLLGFKLAKNFNMPYLAGSIAEFWRRWHISLSTWLRDYLFIPLGGSRGTRSRVCLNLLITMTLGGLWHGAKWTFVIWGICHGLLLIGHRLFRDFAQLRPRLERCLQSPLGSAACVCLTFMTVLFTWILFRAPTLAEAGQIFHSLFVPTVGREPTPVHFMGLLFTYLIVGYCHWAGTHKIFPRLTARMPAPVVGFSYALLLSVTLTLTPAEGVAFIYFQF